MGDVEVKTSEIIGYDAWTIKGRTERFTGEFSDDGNILKGK